MYLIEVKNRAKAQKYLNQKARFYPAVNLHRHQSDGRLFPSLRGGCFFGDEADMVGLKLADIEYVFVGSLTQAQVDEAIHTLTFMNDFIAAQKKGYDALRKDLKPGIDAISKVVDVYMPHRPTPGSSKYYSTLEGIRTRAINMGKRPKIANDYLLQISALEVGRNIGIWSPLSEKAA
jgi:hypothetical protein